MKLFLTLLLFSVCGFSQGLPADQIQGPWKSLHPIYASEASLFLSFYFTKDKMKLTGKCVYPDQSELKTSITVRVNYAASDIYIQEARQSQISDGNRYCRVSLNLTKWQMYFNGEGQAVLVAAIPYGMQFQLIRP